MRAVGYNIWLGGRTKKDQRIEIEDWLPLSTDKKAEKKMWKPTREEYNAIQNRLLKPKK